MKFLNSLVEKYRAFIKKIKPEGGWMSSKKLLIAFSLIASIACWVFLTLYVNADSEKIIADVPIRIDTTTPEEFGLEMIAITAPEVIADGKVDVKIVGSAYQISQVTAEDVTVVAQTSSVNKAGEYPLTLAISCSNRNVEVSLKDSHKSLNVWFDSIKEKSITLDKPLVTGVTVPAGSGFIIGDPSGFIKTVTVSGPESVIARIATVQLRAEANRELSSTATVEGTICYIDENGEVLGQELTNYITILDYNDIGAAEGVPAGAPSSADCIVSIPIRMECELKVVPVFRNVPEGFDTGKLRYSLSQSTIRLEGDIDVMKKYSEDGVFPLDGIDLSTLTPSNRTFTIKLNLSSAEFSRDGITEIKVTFDTSGYKERVLTVSRDRISSINAEGGNAEVTSESVDIRLVGPAAEVDRLTENDISVIVDMEGDEWTPGVREKAAAIHIKEGSGCWLVGTYTVRVRVG